MTRGVGSGRRQRRRAQSAANGLTAKSDERRRTLEGSKSQSWRIAWLLLKTDLVSDFRTFETPLTVLFFAFLQVVIFTFSFYTDDDMARFVAPGVLWVTVAFSGTLAIDRSFAKEQEGRTLTALRLVPGATQGLYVSKLVVNLVYLVLVEIFAAPLVVLVLGVPLEADQIPFIALALFLGSVGFSAVGTVFSAMLVTVRRRGVLLPIILYPVVIPLLVMGVKALSTLIDGRPDPEVLSWIKMMGAVDVLYLVAGAWLFRSVLEDE